MSAWSWLKLKLVSTSLSRAFTGTAGQISGFQKYGGTLRELHSGQPADFFTSEERNELCLKLVEMQYDMREYVSRDIVGLGKKHYLERLPNSNSY